MQFFLRTFFVCTLSSCACALLQTTPSAHPVIPSSSRREVINGWNFFVTAEGLYWVATEDGLYYAQSGVSSNGDTFNGAVKRIHPPWRGGLRLGLGGNLPYDDWVTSLDWTYYYAKKTNKSHDSLLLLWAQPDLHVGFASAEWKLNYNILDFTLGRPFFAGNCFSIFPFFGVRGAWLDQDFHVISSPYTAIKLENDFTGAGIRGGMNIQYLLLSNWSFFGLFSGSLVYGHFHLGLKEEGSTQLESCDGQDQGLPTIQFAGGVRWDKFFFGGEYHVALYAAWEQNYWFHFNKMDHFQGMPNSGVLSRNNGSLSLQGGTFGFQFFF